MWWSMLVLCIFINYCDSQVIYKQKVISYYQIAGIFDRHSNVQRNAFNESMHHVHNTEYQIQTVVLEPLRSDSYSVWREFCSKNMRPIAVVGPQTTISDGAIRHQCARSHIPHIQAAWQPLDPNLEQTNQEAEEQEDDEEIEPTFKKISINFYPDSDELSIALARILKLYGWESFSVLYEDDFGLLRIQKVLAEHSDKYPIVVRRLDPEGDNKEIFKELHRFQESRILMDCHASRIMQYMDDASIVYEKSTMASYYQHYIFAAMDASTVSHRLEKLDCNSTWLSLTRYDDLIISPLSTRVVKWNEESLATQAAVTTFELEALMMDDIANHLIQSLSNMRKINKPRNSICKKDEDGMPMPWADGIDFQNQILNETSLGLTGHIQFDERGRRVNYTLHVNEINVKQRRIVGEWSPTDGSAIKENIRSNVNTANQKNSKEFIVMSRMAQPYFDFKQKCEGDDCEEDPDPDMKYEGFAVDLVDAIFKILRTEQGHNYTYKFINESSEGGYGKYDKVKKKWNGLIGDLLNKKADLAVCDFTITEERKTVVDFSVPFMTLGISILFVQDQKVVPEMFSFLNPYTFEVWMYIATAYCIVSIVMYICARISPADWENPEPCEKDPEFLENIWTFKNCVWLTMGSIMTQGCDILPKAFGTRWVCGMWWFFAVIICQTYIAQLSASMTSALAAVPINSAEDLIKQTKVLYGAYRDGSTLEFFKSSKDKIYQQIYQNMMANDAVLTGGNDEGEKRVSEGKGKYAFFMESSTIEYKLKRNCELKKVGPELDSKDYGIAMPANSPFRSDINTAILRLKELTILQEIKEKWWQKRYGAKNCSTQIEVNDVEGDLEMENLQGAFIVLIAGLLLALIITAAEFANEVRNIVVREQVTHKEVLIKELKASLNFFQMQKPVLRNPSRAPSLVPSLSNRKDKLSGIQDFLDFEKEGQ